MKRGYFKTYAKTFFFILLIALITIGVVYYLKSEYNIEQLETIKTNMLLIEGKTKIIAEKVNIKEKDATYVGRKVEKETEDEKIKYLQEKEIIDLNAKDVNYYILEQSHLEELGLTNIMLEDGLYIVEYTSNEIIYSNGIEIDENTKVYKLSEIEEIEKEKENQINEENKDESLNIKENQEKTEGENEKDNKEDKNNNEENKKSK